MGSKPGPLCQGRNPVNINDGTLCAAPSPKPGVQGDRDWLSSAWDTVSADATWIGNKTLDGAVWAGTETIQGMVWAEHEISAGAAWTWQEMRSAAFWSWDEFRRGGAWISAEVRGGAIWMAGKVYDAYQFLLGLIDQIKKAADWKSLNALVEPILGSQSLMAGALYGMVESLVKDVVSLLELGKMIVLAGMYEMMQHPRVAVAVSFNPAMAPTVLTSLALGAAASRIPWFAAQMKKADEQLKKMIQDLLGIARHPGDFFQALGKSMKEGAINDWNTLKYNAEHPTVTGDFQAGRIIGRLLYQIIMLILLVMSVAGAVAKIAAKVPWLLRAARILKVGGEVEELVEAEKIADAAKVAEDAAEAERTAAESKTATPKEPPKKNPKTRLPRSNGEWKNGVPGNGDWYSNNPKVTNITQGEPVRFTDGRPDFSPWSKGEIEFEPGELDGTDADFDKVYDQIMEEKGLSSRAAAKAYLKDQGLTPHHLDNNTIQLVPSDLHNNVPHVGAASDLRGGYGASSEPSEPDPVTVPDDSPDSAGP